MRRNVDLNGTWTLTFGQQTPVSPQTPDQLDKCDWLTIPARVPGNVELDLIEAGRLPRELHKGNTVYTLTPLEFNRWWYRRSFANVRTPAGNRAMLVLEGVDCIADVYLNGRIAGHCRNMLIEHRFDITAQLSAADENQLDIRIDSSVLEGRKHRPDAVEFSNTANSWEALSVRKAPHMYGWDILPRIVSAGLWRGVRIEFVPTTRLEDVYWATLSTDAAKREAEVFVSWHIASEVANLRGWKIAVDIVGKRGSIHHSERAVISMNGRARLRLSDVDLWWPRGSGEPSLHDARVTLFNEKGEELDEQQIRLGIRTLHLRRTDVTDEKGSGEFVFVVNGRKVYVRGTNHVPLDSLHSRDPQHLTATLDLVADLNCNMLRCWGGNVYEDHAFFDGCDERGIMVWQDFAMACSVYPQTESFAREIRIEAEAIVRKLRHHASLALWAGNNEIDQAYGWSGLGLDPNTDVLSRQVLPDVVRRMDPHRDYLPSSPYISPALYKMGNLHTHTPEDHLWGPRDDFKGPYYNTSSAHFVSETGYHGCPNRETMEAMMEPDFLWPWQNNDQWLTHCVRPDPHEHSCDYRVELMAKQIRVLFERDPDNLDDYILASQASQAESVKYFIETWRIGKWRRTGMLWWNVRDGWPVISDALVDYFFRKKLSYEVIKRVHADVCVSLGEPRDGKHTVHILNDTLKDANLSIAVRDVDTGRVLFQSNATGKADSTTAIGEIPAAPVAAMRSIAWGTGQNHYLAGPRPFKLPDYRRWLSKVGLLTKQ